MLAWHYATWRKINHQGCFATEVFIRAIHATTKRDVEYQRKARQRTGVAAWYWSIGITINQQIMLDTGRYRKRYRFLYIIFVILRKHTYCPNLMLVYSKKPAVVTLIGYFVITGNNTFIADYCKIIFNHSIFSICKTGKLATLSRFL